MCWSQADAHTHTARREFARLSPNHDLRLLLLFCACSVSDGYVARCCLSDCSGQRQALAKLHTGGTGAQRVRLAPYCIEFDPACDLVDGQDHTDAHTAVALSEEKT